MKTEVVTFRCTPAQRKKLNALAAGMGETPSSVLAQLVEDAQVVPVEVRGLALVGEAERQPENLSVAQ